MSDIAQLGEFGLIQKLTADIKPKQESTLLGIGDDCAVVKYAAENSTVVTTDLLIEGVHFDLTYTPLQHLGYKAVVMNLSDIYAMNATPRQITISLGISAKFCVEDIEALYLGMRHACETYNVDIVGGDTCSSKTGLTISITALGEAPKEQLVYRNGAKTTNLICVSGNLGAAYMGLQLLEREKMVYNQQLAEARKTGNKEQMEALQYVQPDFSGKEYLLERQLRPEARRDVVEALAKAGIQPTAMIDISDGLSSELLHLCKQSHTGCRIMEDRIPLDYQTAVAAEEFDINVSTCALNGGEDFELLFTVPVELHEKIEEIEDVKVIGYMTAEDEGCQLITRDDKVIALKAQGWTHLS